MATEKEKKRPRPLDLSHSNLVEGQEKDMSQFALQCVSPGLPPLSAKMKTTVLQSKSIEQQQRQIIAQRAGNGSLVDESDESKLATPSTSGLTDTMEDLSIPSEDSNKRLKRGKVPAPLNLLHAHAQRGPTIKTAPIYNFPQFFTPAPSRRSQSKMTRQALRPRSAIPHRPGPQFRGQMTPLATADPYLRQIPSSAYPYSQQQSRFGGHMPPLRQIPHTATTPRHPIMNQSIPPSQRQFARYENQLAYQQHQWAKFKQYQESQRVSHVTDVFQGKGSRFAPLEAQPLSAQNKFFDVRPQTIIKDDGIKEENENDDDDDDDGDGDDDPESAAIEADAQVGKEISKEQIVNSELRLGSDVFRFELKREGKQDRERFLKHCEIAWDEYNKL